MNRLTLKDRAKILHCLVEGNSLRSTSRLCDVSINTVTKLLVDVGYACAMYQAQVLTNLPCKRLQCDEIWAFCYSKQKSTPEADFAKGRGDVWTWTAICADTKLIAGWFVGDRTSESAYEFMTDLASRLKNRVQLTTDGFKSYLHAVDDAFSGHIDYAMLQKLYGAPAGGIQERRYSPQEVRGTIIGTVSGNPDPEHISTSYVERQNLTMRMTNRRFTRLTNGFSKKIENHEHAIALHFMFYNFGRIHKTLRVTPAMEAGINDHVWTLEEIAALAD